jgi:hypothetical protein
MAYTNSAAMSKSAARRTTSKHYKTQEKIVMIFVKCVVLVSWIFNRKMIISVSRRYGVSVAELAAIEFAVVVRRTPPPLRKAVVVAAAATVPASSTGAGVVVLDGSSVPRIPSRY